MENESIIQTRTPGWVQDTASQEFINTGTGEVLLPSEYYEEVQRTKPHTAEMGQLTRAPTLQRLEMVKESLLNLKEAFMSGNKWTEDPNPNQEVGETATGYWRTRYYLSEPVEQIFVHEAGCDNKMHPIEDERLDRHEKDDQIADLIDTVYEIFHKTIYRLYNLQQTTHLTDILTVLSLLNDGLNFEAMSSDEGEDSIPDLISLAKKQQEIIKDLTQKQHEHIDDIMLYAKQRDDAVEALESARRTKTWLWKQLELKDNRLEDLKEALHNASITKNRLRTKLFARKRE